eukprot:s728_g41.t1
MDRHLDGDPIANLEFLTSQEKLTKKKIENPSLRLTPGILREKVEVSEGSTQGVKAPKNAFMELSQYRKKYGEPDPDSLKFITWKGRRIQGVDVVGVYEYIEQEEQSLERTTQLNDEEAAGGKEAVILPLTTAFATEGHQKDHAGVAAEDADGTLDVDMDYDNDEDMEFNPFASLWNRLAPSQTQASLGRGRGSGSASAGSGQPEAKRQAKAKATPAAGEPRGPKRSSPTGDATTSSKRKKSKGQKEGKQPDDQEDGECLAAAPMRLDFGNLTSFKF